MFIKLNIIVLVLVLLLSGCKSDKQPEYVDEKPAPQQDTPKSEVKKIDTPVTRTDSVKKDEIERDKFDYRRSEEPVAVIGPLDASNYMGKFVTVKGFVADVYKSDKVAYLNFVEKFPDNPFTGVIFANKFDEFGDIQVYEGRNVEISGRISTFRGKPQMILDKKSQIKIVN